MAYEKPLPILDNWNTPFWEACKEHRLIAQKCSQSGELWLPPSPVSPVTRTPDWTWEELSGKGTVWSWVRMHQRYVRSFADDLPYNVAQIELDEGPMLISNIVDAGDREITIGMLVRVVFEDATDEIAIPKFTPT